MSDFMPNMAGIVTMYYLHFPACFRDPVVTKTKEVNRPLS